MANTLVTSSIVAEEASPFLENMLTFGPAVNRDWEDTFQSASAAGYKPGLIDQRQKTAALHVPRSPRCRSAVTVES
ncbi:MAG: hypothetical protein IPK44_25425, partial [Candidatus Accumulibacter sp.]|uniref:hypothetical protein n=1 Tax=Accumulibacter sp. TaxID=2053492 RepID=UPI002587C692